MTNYKLIKKLVCKREKELESIIDAKRIDLAEAPEGLLRTAKCRNKIQYFKRDSVDDFNGTYIKKADLGLAIQLAQKEYDLKTIAAAEKEIVILNSLSSVYNSENIEQVAEKMVKEKAALVNKVCLSDEEYIKQWLSQEYVHNTTYPENLKVENSKGIKMRSKSEVLISNILDEYNIPYLYEKPLRLGNYRTVSPDFTLLDMRDRSEVYLEHLGMIDSEEYLAKNLDKINEYIENGYFLGSKLLISYETSKEPLNIKKVRAMLEKYFSTML